MSIDKLTNSINKLLVNKDISLELQHEKKQNMIEKLGDEELGNKVYDEVTRITLPKVHAIQGSALLGYNVEDISNVSQGTIFRPSEKIVLYEQTAFDLKLVRDVHSLLAKYKDIVDPTVLRQYALLAQIADRRNNLLTLLSVDETRLSRGAVNRAILEIDNLNLEYDKKSFVPVKESLLNNIFQVNRLEAYSFSINIGEEFRAESNNYILGDS